RDETFRPADGYGEAFIRIEQPRGARGIAMARRLDDLGIIAALALPAGIFGMLLDRGAGRQLDDGLCLLDREGPGIAGDVPIELVIVREITELACRAVGDLVDMRAIVEEHIGTADADTLAIADRHDRVGFIMPVALHANDREADDVIE